MTNQFRISTPLGRRVAIYELLKGFQVSRQISVLVRDESIEEKRLYSLGVMLFFFKGATIFFESNGVLTKCNFETARVLSDWNRRRRALETLSPNKSAEKVLQS